MACKSSIIFKDHDSHDVTQETDDSRFHASLTNLESLIPCDVESRAVSSSKEATCSSHNIPSRPSLCQSEFISSSQYGGNFTISGPIPSEIGFHLNNIAGPVPMGSSLITSNEFPGYMSSQEDKLIPEESNHLAQDSNSCFISTAGKLQAHLDNDSQDDQAVVGTSSATSQYTDRMKLLCDSLQATVSEQQEAGM
ncbi:CXC domain-containing protein [Melia azedarach]|uniref:CXC domain-containing protein n=1 Tax=Melia azedarach TaxID=155640 RepID=A0ACC1Y4K6_MELAZ|nr:CXC domain-containing protein [Melia azedarach]